MTSWAVCDNLVASYPPHTQGTCFNRPHPLEVGWMLAHLVSIEVEEDPYSHLCNEDQQ